MKKIVLILLIVLFLFTSCDINFRGNAEKKEDVKNQTTVDIEIDKNLVNDKNIDTILIESYLLDRSGYPVRSTSTSYDKTEISNKDTLSFDLKNFGKSEITLYYKKGGKVLDKKYLDYVLTAERYNIGYLIATVPVTYFTLMMVDRDGSKDIIDPTLPTIFSLERATSYNFDNLLDNMYPLPFVSEDKLREGHYADECLRASYDYIGYLHELNPSSTFNVIAYDRSPEDAILLLYCNGLDPKENRITLLSDGAGTFGDFKNVYGEESGKGLGLYNDKVEKWKEIKKRALSGDLYFGSVEENGIPFSSRKCQLVAYNAVLINDENIDVKWVFSRKRNDTFGNSDVYEEKIKSNTNAQELNMQSYVKAGTGTLDSDEIASLKALFNFNDGYFEKAEENGKKCVIFLGTASGEEKETLRDYLSFMVNYLDSDEYEFYYKGHPGHIYSYPERNSIAQSFNITILDPAIPAELFVLFKPDLDMCGYQSSTYAVFPDGYKAPFTDIENASYSEVYIDKANSTVGKEYLIKRHSDGKVMHWKVDNPSVLVWE